MKKLHLSIIVLLFLQCSPDKAIEEKEENLVIKAMTSGEWKVSSFNRAGTDITADFAAYKFQFMANLTVNAVSNGVIERTGSWNGNVTTQTITTDFPSASVPLLLLNGNWRILGTTWTSVRASQTVGSEERLLNLQKL